MPNRKRPEYIYKGYNPKNSKHVQRYNKDHYKLIGVRFDISFYEESLKPLCEELGITVASFAKEATLEKFNLLNSKDGSKN